LGAARISEFAGGFTCGPTQCGEARCWLRGHRRGKAGGE
jgi:hypothetical protein